MAEQVTETHDSVLAILDEVGLGTVADVDLLARVCDGTGDLPLTLLVGDAEGVTLLVDDGDGGVRLAEVDTEDSWACHCEIVWKVMYQVSRGMDLSLNLAPGEKFEKGEG